MKSPFATLVRALIPAAPTPTPIPYVGSGIGGLGLSMLFADKPGAEHQMTAYGTNGTLFPIVSRLANSTSMVNWRLWRKAASGLDEDRTEVTSHACIDLWEQPNSFMSGQEFREGFQQHIDLTGEGWWVIGRSARSALPLSLFYVRPDRMRPEPHPTKFLTGWTYVGPEGQELPLRLDEAIQLKMPNPLDPYRGLGPVQAAMIDLDSARLGAEWNRNFFRNDASPGGIIEVDKRLDDARFLEMTDRWRSQHQGVANAHRVAVIEEGHWQDRSFNMRDMQFVELRGLSDEMIRKAFGFPVPMLGTVVDVNRANNDAQKAFYSDELIGPRADRIKGALNGKLLPMYGPEAARTLEWDYDPPAPPDLAQELAQLVGRAQAAKALREAGYDAADILEACGLPEMRWEKPAAPPALQPPADPAGEDQAAIEARLVGIPAPPPFAGSHHRHGPVAAADSQRTDELARIQADWAAALAALLGAWAPITAAHREHILGQVEKAVSAGDVEALGKMTLDARTVTDGQEVLTDAMAILATSAARRVVDEAAEQGVNLEPAELERDQLAEWAYTVSVLLGGRLILSAGREALRRNTTSSTPAEVTAAVRGHLEGLSLRDEKDHLGGALTNAQNSARMETMREGTKLVPNVSFYADETLDGETCKFCRAVDGRWLGPDVDAVERIYPNGGYVDCLGRERCRGTVMAVWRPEQTG